MPDTLKAVEKELEHTSDKIGFLKEHLEKHPSYKKEIRELLVKEIKEKNLLKTPVTKDNILYKLVYDSVGEGLEPIYFWILDFMRDKYQGLGLEVSKTADDYEASVGGGYFGEMGIKSTRMQEQAMKMLQTINAVVRSLINLLYDLREFEMRLETYDRYKSKLPSEREAALLSLKALWMDRVDINRGRGSINALAAQLQFITLRDAFMAAESVKEADKLDLNERIKRILKPRLQEFFDWLEKSEKEIRRRFNIEKSYLRSQVGSLKLYAQWTKPYLVAAQKLGMKDMLTAAGEPSPDLVNAFSNVVMDLVLFGKKEITPEDVDLKYKNVKLSKKYYACTEAVIRFRTVPQAVSGRAGTHFVHGGKTTVEFRGYVLTDKDLEFLKRQELYEGLDLIEEIVGTSLAEMREDIDRYLRDEEEVKKQEKVEEVGPFKALIGGFKDMIKIFKGVGREFGDLTKISKPMPYKEKEVREKAEEEVRNDNFTLYDVYKKAHGMLSW